MLKYIITWRNVVFCLVTLKFIFNNVLATLPQTTIMYLLTGQANNTFDNIPQVREKG